jgi:hypothetical protein
MHLYAMFISRKVAKTIEVISKPASGVILNYPRADTPEKISPFSKGG